MALVVSQHDQAVGLHHGAEHARALVAGGADHQFACRIGADDAALVFGAAGFLAQGFRAFGLEQGQGWRLPAHELLESRAHKGCEGDHDGHRVTRQAKQHSRALTTLDAAHGHGAAGAHGDAPEGHIAQFFHHGLGVIGFAYAHATAGDDGVGLVCGMHKGLLQRGRLVAHHAHVDQFTAQGLHHARHGVAVAVVHRAFAGGFAQAQDLVTG